MMYIKIGNRNFSFPNGENGSNAAFKAIGRSTRGVELVGEGHEGGFGDCRAYDDLRINGVTIRKYYPSWIRRGSLEIVDPC